MGKRPLWTMVLRKSLQEWNLTTTYFSNAKHVLAIKKMFNEVRLIPLLHDDVIKWKHFPVHERLSKQSWGWWFETLSRPLWRHSNGSMDALAYQAYVGTNNYAPDGFTKESSIQ